MVYTVLVSFSKRALDQKLEEIRKQGNIAIGVLVYDVENDRLDMHIFRDQTLEEVAALLAKFSIGIKEIH